MAPKLKVGMPNWNGRTMANQATWSRLAKLTLPRAMAISMPMTSPSSTEMLAKKPFTNRVMSRIETSTTAATARCRGAP